MEISHSAGQIRALERAQGKHLFLLIHLNLNFLEVQHEIKFKYDRVMEIQVHYSFRWEITNANVVNEWSTQRCELPTL